MKYLRIVLVSGIPMLACADDCTNGYFSCTVESIRSASANVFDPCDAEDTASSNFCESAIYLEVQCVISNKTPYDVDLTRQCIDSLFDGEYVYAKGDKGDAIRMTAYKTDWYYSPKKQKFRTLKSKGRCRVKTKIGAGDSTELYKRLHAIQWQMLDHECIMMRGWIRTKEGVTSHSYEDAMRFEVEVTYPKTLPLEEMGAFPRKWRDPKTGIEWTYRVFRNEVVLGGGDGWETAIEKETTGAVKIPAVIDGMPVVSIGNAAFMLCEVESMSVPPSVRSIGYGAFDQCHDLKELSISSNVTDIAVSAFRYCHDLVIRRY